VRKLVASDNDGDQASDLGNGSGEEGLERGEAGIERRSALRQRERRRDGDKTKEDERWANPAQPLAKSEATPSNVKGKRGH
jgi:hypothetical protein